MREIWTELDASIIQNFCKHNEVELQESGGKDVLDKENEEIQDLTAEVIPRNERIAIISAEEKVLVLMKALVICGEMDEWPSQVRSIIVGAVRELK